MAISHPAHLYAKVPNVSCKGLCARRACSGGIPAIKQERDAVGARGFELTPFSAGDNGKPCPALSAFGRCQVYEVRPLICRLWGVADNMPCPHGCTPDEPLSVADAARLVAELERDGLAT